MKMSPEVYRELISIFQAGMLQSVDVSDEFRSLELKEKDGLLFLVNPPATSKDE